ncbi:zinc finger protein 778-like [Aphis craccivora]|uniref:Zinc finger protein 778-like n=1 Tax=Aphis craccivora TaxID=307492 RepID=A0A6G0YNM3_APHCR|nr:zinc finger protein 778-like [Aphis craccivora]
MFSCEVFEAKFQSISDFNKHMRNKHKDLKKTKVYKHLYKCNDCNENVDLKKALIQHVKSHLIRNVQRQSLCS